MSISRRNFLKTSAGVTAAASIASPVMALTQNQIPFEPGPGNKWPGRVVLNYNENHEATQNSGSTSDREVIAKMVDDAMKMLTAQTDVGEAWKAIFPDTLSASSTIAIKVNMLEPRIPSHPFVVKGIVEGLKQMEFNGDNFPAYNIYIYDGNNSSNFSGAGFNQDDFPGVNLIHYGRNPAYPVSGTNYTDGAREEPYAPALHDSDFLINIPGIRGHSSGERFTLGYKSHYGTYPTRYHDNTNIRGYLRDIVGTGPVYQKHVLTVVSALFGLKEGSGPTGSWGSSYYYDDYVVTKVPSSDDHRPNTIVVTTDPVTAEFHAVKIMRIGHGGGYDVEDMPRYLQASAGIAGSLSDRVLNYGIIDESEMQYGEIVNEEITVPIDDPTDNKKRPKQYTNNLRMKTYIGPMGTSSFIEFIAPGDYIGKTVEISIVNMRGRTVRTMSQKLLGRRTRAVWDGTGTAGRRVASSSYIIKARVGMRNLTGKITLKG